MRQKGMVKWFNDNRGYGFIEPAGGGKDIFVHYTAIRHDGYRSLAEGDEVEFEVVQGRQGMQAAELVKL